MKFEQEHRNDELEETHDFPQIQQHQMMMQEEGSGYIEEYAEMHTTQFKGTQ